MAFVRASSLATIEGFMSKFAPVKSVVCAATPARAVAQEYSGVRHPRHGAAC